MGILVEDADATRPIASFVLAPWRNVPRCSLVVDRRLVLWINTEYGAADRFTPGSSFRSFTPLLPRLFSHFFTLDGVNATGMNHL